MKKNNKKFTYFMVYMKLNTNSAVSEINNNDVALLIAELSYLIKQRFSKYF